MGLPTLSVTELVRNFSEYIGRIAFRGESFLVVKGRRPVAELRPVHAGRRLGDLTRIAEALPPLAEGDADVFARQVAEARQQYGEERLRDPWDAS